jgi:hypothetical protein
VNGLEADSIGLARQLVQNAVDDVAVRRVGRTGLPDPLVAPARNDLAVPLHVQELELE